jgi:hypothetical protein
MRHYLFSTLYLIAFTGLIASCKNEEKKEDSLFPIYSFLQSQVASADSSLLPLRRIDIINDSTRDTTYFPRQEFRREAGEFLALPDLTQKAFKDRYKETDTYDPDLNRLIIYQMPVNPEQELIQRQELLVEPSTGGDKIRTVIVQTAEVSKDSSIEKRMIWNVDESFQVTRIRQLPGQPEEVRTYRVEWNINE